MSDFDDRVWRELLKRIDRLEDAHVKVGLVGPEAAQAHSEGSDLTNAEIGTVHEFGSPARGIPERSFLRSTFTRREGDLAALQARACRGLLQGTIDVDKALGLIGAWAVGAIKATITRDGSFVPLKPATIARKGSARPLVDTGQLVGSITFVVVSASASSTGSVAA